MAEGPRVGIWVDHREARLVRCGANGTDVATMKSDVRGLRRSTGHRGVPLPAHLGGDDENKRRHRRTLELNRYYDRIAKQLGPQDSIVVLGPGSVPRAFQRRLERRHPAAAARLVGSATSDRMTEPQLVARVRELFRDADRRSGAGRRDA